MRLGDCKHFVGLRTSLCGAGLDIRKVVGGPDLGWAIRTPCLADHSTVGDCHRYKSSTTADVELYRQEVEAAIERMKKTLPLIASLKAAHKGTNASGVAECPICGGKLHWTHAALNGHVWGHCETKDCVAWME